ncbi:hypothetical protein ACFW5V_37850 [Streptomyces sp. NPDC058762]|uniref:hypothetical protein n=1 Tax=Streptomyces sp. NPDC058762 TaxID=3346629 RepID=UPI0036B05B83
MDIVFSWQLVPFSELWHLHRMQLGSNTVEAYRVAPPTGGVTSKVRVYLNHELRYDKRDV